MANLPTGKELEQLWSFTGRLHPSHCSTVVKSKFNCGSNCTGMFEISFFHMYYFEKQRRFKQSHSPHPKHEHVRSHFTVACSKVDRNTMQKRDVLKGKPRVCYTQWPAVAPHKPPAFRTSAYQAQFGLYLFLLLKIAKSFQHANTNNNYCLCSTAEQLLTSSSFNTQNGSISKARLDTRMPAAYKQGQNMILLPQMTNIIAQKLNSLLKSLGTSMSHTETLPQHVWNTHKS